MPLRVIFLEGWLRFLNVFSIQDQIIGFSLLVIPLLTTLFTTADVEPNSPKAEQGDSGHSASPRAFSQSFAQPEHATPCRQKLVYLHSRIGQLCGRRSIFPAAVGLTLQLMSIWRLFVPGMGMARSCFTAFRCLSTRFSTGI